MISRITGKLDAIETDKALIDPGHGMVYEVMLPAFAANRLAVKTGQIVTLFTFEFFESTGQGATMFPRMAGFLSPQDKKFFELFVTCKGIGHKRALRAMILDTNTLASAIADRDAKLIQTMPEVGKKLAETIVVTLRDKVDHFVSAAAYPAPGSQGGAAGDAVSGKPGDAGVSASAGHLARESLEVLIQLGENRTQAVQWIDRVLAVEIDRDDRPSQVQDVVAAVYRIKAGS